MIENANQALVNMLHISKVDGSILSKSDITNSFITNVSGSVCKNYYSVHQYTSS